MRHGSARAGRITHAVVVFVCVVVFVAPIWWLVSAAFDADQRPGRVSLLPSAPTLQNLVTAADLGFFQRVGISVLVAGLSVVLGLVVASTAAFAFVHYRNRWTNVLFAVVVVSFLLPFEALSVPLASVFGRLGLLDTLGALVVPGVANGLAVYNVTQAYLGIPREFVEAAALDGAGPLRIYRTVYLPLGIMPLIGSAVLIFGAQWNAYLWPLLVVTGDGLKTAPIAIAANFGDKQAGYGVTFAEILVLTAIPLLLLFVTQRRLTESFISSGLR